MPRVKTKSGKVKRYPYTKKGKDAAKKARKRVKKKSRRRKKK